MAETPASDMASGAHEGASVFPPFDPTYFPSQLFWLAIAFGTLYWLIKKRAAPRIGGILADRQERIDTDLAEAKRLKAETDEVIAAYEQELEAARKTAHKIAAETRERVKADAEARRAEMDREVAAKLTTAEKRIAAAQANAFASIDRIATDVSAAMTERLLSTPPDRAVIESAVANAAK